MLGPGAPLCKPCVPHIVDIRNWIKKSEGKEDKTEKMNEYLIAKIFMECIGLF